MSVPAQSPDSDPKFSANFWSTRGRYLIGIVLVIPLGLGSRHYQEQLPQFIGDYAGDTLWALLVFFLFSLVIPRTAAWQRGCYAIAFSIAVEISQLYHAPWIDALREFRLGGWVLGYQFVWTDLVCYLVGVGTGVLLDAGWSRNAVTSPATAHE